MNELTRFFLQPSQPRQGQVRIEGTDAHHITRVLRLRPGHEIECIAENGQVYLVEINETGETVSGTVKEKRTASSESPLSLSLFQGLAKGDRMDWAVQKAVELGVGEIIPFTSRYTVVRLNAKQQDTRRQRWERIALEAAKQCGRTALPKVRPILNWEQVLEEVSKRVGRRELALLAYEGEVNMGLGDITVAPQAVSVLIGPEGGFAAPEAAALVEAGAERITLGPRTLRTETAGLVALSLIGYRWGDLR